VVEVVSTPTVAYRAKEIMEQVIYLEVDDEITEIIDKLRSTAAENVVLVVPKGAKLVASPINLKLLRRQLSFKKINLVCLDSGARQLAGEIGFPVYASLKAYRAEQPEVIEKSSKEQPVRTFPVGTETKVIAPKTAPRSTTLIWVGLILFFVLIIAGAGVALFLVVPEGEVAVTPVLKELPLIEADVNADPGAKETNVATRVIPATLVEKEFSDSKTGAATGSKTVGDLTASGSVLFGNKTYQDIEIGAGVIVYTEGGVQFKTVESKTLPAATAFRAGTVAVNIVAVLPGSAGNVPAGAIYRVDSDKYEVTNPEATSGGTDKVVTVVTQEDYQQIKAELTSKFEAQGQEFFKNSASVPSGQKLIAESVQFVVTEATPPEEVVNKEMTSFTVRVKGKMKGTTIAQDQPDKILTEILRKSTDSGYVVAESTVVVSTQASADGKPKPPTPDPNGTVILHMDVSGSQYAALDTDRIKSELKGKTLSEAKAYLGSLGLQNFELKVSPEWWGRFPYLDFRIRVKIQIPTRK